jgi:hypothetical protein
MRVVSCAPTEKKCGSAGSAGTAVTWTSVADAAVDDEEGDGDVPTGFGEGDGVAEGDSAGEIGGARVTGKHALAITLNARTMMKNVRSRCIGPTLDFVR